MYRSIISIVVVLFITLALTATASAPTNTAGPLDCSTGICTSKLVSETIPANSTQFRWTNLNQQFNNANAGENVATYSQMWKKGLGNSWGSVSEARCINPRNGCHGLEVDLVLNGELDEAAGDWRLGQSIVLWQLPGSTGVPTATNALYIAGGLPHREDVRTKYGVNVDLHCNVACLRVRSGEKIVLSDDDQIAIRFNPVTDNVELLNGTRVIWKVSAQ